MEEICKVYKTKDYSQFKFLLGNRKINKANLMRIKKSMINKHLICPIIVNNNREIIDGQHRFVAQMELELDVYFMIIEGYGLEETQTFNSYSKNWTPTDYMNSYCDSGNKEYIQYRYFFEYWKFPHNECMNMLNGTIHERLHTVFNYGGFIIKEYKQAEEYASRITQLEKYYDGFKRRSFVRAMLVCFKNERFNFKHFYKKLRYQSTQLVDCTSFNEYLKVIEKIYNYRIRTADKLRLF